MARTPTHTDVEFVRFPNLSGVELRHSSYRDSVFRTHTHPSWSIGLIESGSTTFALTGRSHHAVAGQIVVIGPGCAHACNPTDGDSFSYVMFYLSLEWLVGNEPDREFPAFAEPVIDDAPLFRQWEAVYRQLTADPSAAKCALLKAAITALVAEHAKPDTEPLSGEDREGVAKAKLLLRDRIDQRVKLQQLAAETNMSRSHLSRTFTRAEGLPPHAYHNQLRVERAKELLASGEQLAQVGTTAGFTDQSHFTRVFRDYTGATPSQYQATNARRD